MRKPLTTSATHHQSYGYSLCICPLIICWPSQRWQTECSVGDSELLQVFGNLHHRQRFTLWHWNCFMKGKRTSDIKREEFVILLETLCHSVTFLEEKKKTKNVLPFASLNKVQIYCCKAFHWFSSTIRYMLVFMRTMYVRDPEILQWNPENLP